MAQVSGIGTYLRALLPAVMARLPEVRFTLLGRPVDREILDAAIFDSAVSTRCEWRDVAARHLSLREQVAVPRAVPRDTDLLWIPHFNVPVVAAARVPALAVTLHDILIAEPGFGSALGRAYARLVFPVIRRYADPVFCVSAFTRRRWRQRFGGGAEPLLTPNGVSAQWRAAAPGPLPAHLGVPTDRPYVLYVGNVKPHKNLVRLIRAFTSIAPRVEHRLLLVGNLEGLRSVDHRAARLADRSDGRIRRLGYVPHEDLPRVVAGAEAFVFPSLYEGFGLPPLEAMAAGTAVVAADIPAVREGCGEAARYVDPRDEQAIARGLLEVLQDSARRADLVARGRRRAATMTWVLKKR